MDGDHHDALVGHHKNGMDDRNALKMVVSLLNRNYVRHDLKMVLKMAVNLGLRMSDPLDDHSMVVNLLNRNYAPRDLMMDANLDGKNLHVK